MKYDIVSLFGLTVHLCFTQTRVDVPKQILFV